MGLRDDFDEYSDMQKRIKADALNEISRFIESIDASDTAKARNAIIEYAMAVMSGYGTALGLSASDFFTSVSGLASVGVANIIEGASAQYLKATVIEPGALAKATGLLAKWRPEVDRLARYAVGLLAVGSTALAVKAVSEKMELMLNEPASEVMRENALEHNVKWARVPSGAETCPFCTMLASRGFEYASERTAGGDKYHGTDLDRYHPGCDCAIVAGSPGDSMPGYDPDKMYAQYLKARGTIEHQLPERWNSLSTEEKLKRYAVDGTPSYDKFVSKQILSEMQKRSRLWLSSGVEPETVYLKSIEEFLAEKNGKRDLFAHGILSRNGFAVTARKEGTLEGFSNIDLLINGELWELKSPEGRLNANGEPRFVENNLRKAVQQFYKQYGTDQRDVKIVFNGYFCEASDEQMEKRIAAEVRRHGIAEVLYIAKDGSVRRYFGKEPVLHQGEKGNKNPDAGSQKNRGGDSSHAKGWSSDVFGSFSDMQKLVSEAESLDDLKKRVSVIEDEWGKTGLSDKYRESIRAAVRAKKKSIG